jgi:hypothetical protein
MFTLHHGFWTYFLTRSHREVWKFVLGSMLPDYVYGLFFIILIKDGLLDMKELLDVSPIKMMALLPLYPWVVKVDLIGHSVVFWAVSLLLVLFPAFSKMQAFVIGWGSHLFVDALTHAAHANFYLYPLSMAAVHSPVSYWDTQYFAREFRLVNGILMGVAILYLASRKIYQWWKNREK